MSFSRLRGVLCAIGMGTGVALAQAPVAVELSSLLGGKGLPLSNAAAHALPLDANLSEPARKELHDALRALGYIQ